MLRGNRNYPFIAYNLFPELKKGIKNINVQALRILQSRRNCKAFELIKKPKENHIFIKKVVQIEVSVEIAEHLKDIDKGFQDVINSYVKRNNP